MNWKRFFAAVFALLVILSFGSTRLTAQTATSGDIAGVVTDPSGATVPGAKVTLKDDTKGNTQETTTNKDGVYHFYLLSPGPYTVTVAATGFETFTRHSSVNVGQIATLNVQMTLGAATTSVTVTESAPLLQTDNGDTGTAVTQQQVANVPNPGNDLTAIAQLAPGVIANNQGGFGNVEAFGLPATSNLFTMNGMDDNDPFLNLSNSGASNLLLGSNEIQEADVVTNGFSAAYGTFAGIDVNYVTKSGGNQYHGNAVYYWNGRAMNANDWFDKANGLPRAFDNANQWAASFGGPIKKDKIFFFVNQEGLRVLIPVPASIFVPTPAFEAATVTNLTNLGLASSIPFYCQNLAGICPGVAGVPGSGAGAFNLFNGAQNQSSAANTLPVGCVTNSAGVCVPTGLGPGCSNVPNAGAFAGLTGPCAVVLRENPVNFAPEWQIAGRFDWNIGPNDRVFMRMQYDVGTQPTYSDPVNPIFNSSSYQPEYQGQLNETHTFGPTLTNQFLLAATWYSAIFNTTNRSGSLAAFPTTLLMGDGSLGNPNNSSIALGGDNFAFPQGRNVTQFQVNDDVSKSWGNHTFKFGGTLHRNYVSDHDFGDRAIGLLIPFSLADFANGGAVATNSAGTELQQNFTSQTNEPIRTYEVAGYFQDDFRVMPNLTISPGLRIEHASNPICVTLCFAQLSAPLADIGADPGAPYNQQIQDLRRNALLSYQKVQWSPRLSFAWQPFGSSASGMLRSNFVVRGGVGIFYDIFPGSIADNMAQNPPLFNPFTVFSAAATAGSCASTGFAGFLSPNQPGNIFGCASNANSAFLTAFNTGQSTTANIPNVTITDAQTKAPQYQKWNLQIQKGFGANDVVVVGYNGNHGIHLPIFNNSVNTFGLPAGFNVPAEPTTSQFGGVTDVTSAGISNYNGLTASYQHRFNGFGGGLVQINYTFSKAMDDVSNGGFFGFGTQSVLFPQNPFNIRGNYGPADYDARHVVNANYVWQVPVRKMLMGHGWAPLVDGWQVSGTVFYRTGFPFTVIDVAGSEGLAGNNYFADLFPNVVSGSTLGTSCNSERFAGPNAVSCLTSTQFVGVGGNETEFGVNGLKNAFRGPSYFDTDFSFVKNTKIPHWERGQLGLGLQFFNLFNHPNFSQPVNDASNPGFGQIFTQVNPPTSILGSFLGGNASPRLIQLKAQLTF
jgi:Carboxypeptidase regulatory-like domain/TonB-dependent Receptor Plug Domain